MQQQWRCVSSRSTPCRSPLRSPPVRPAQGERPAGAPPALCSSAKHRGLKQQPADSGAARCRRHRRYPLAGRTGAATRRHHPSHPLLCAVSRPSTRLQASRQAAGHCRARTIAAAAMVQIVEGERASARGHKLYSVAYLPDGGAPPAALLCWHHGVAEHIGRYSEGACCGGGGGGQRAQARRAKAACSRAQRLQAVRRHPPWRPPIPPSSAALRSVHPVCRGGHCGVRGRHHRPRQERGPPRAH